MKTVIFCGGQGYRLREETEFRPKPMVPIGRHPIIWHIMKIYEHYGLRDFVLPLGYKGDVIKEYFLNYRTMENDCTVSIGADSGIAHHDGKATDRFRVTLADTGTEHMTGSRLMQVRDHLGNATFMATYGDGLSDINLHALLKFHKDHGKIATVTSVRMVSRFGILDIRENGRVDGFVEKPEIDDWINAGFFVFEPEIFEYLSEDPHCILEQNPLAALAQDGQLMAYKHEGFFFAMDTYREYKKLNEMWEKNDAPWACWSPSATLDSSQCLTPRKRSGAIVPSSLRAAAASSAASL